MNLHEIAKPPPALQWGWYGGCTSPDHIGGDDPDAHHVCFETMGNESRTRHIYCECDTCLGDWEARHYIPYRNGHGYVCDGCQAGFHPTPPEY